MVFTVSPEYTDNIQQIENALVSAGGKDGCLSCIPREKGLFAFKDGDFFILNWMITRMGER